MTAGLYLFFNILRDDLSLKWRACAANRARKTAERHRGSLLCQAKTQSWIADPARLSLASRPEMLITRPSVGPGRELNGRSQQYHLWCFDVAGPVGPSSRASAFLSLSRVLSEGFEGLAAGDSRANSRKGRPCLFMSMFFSRVRMRAPSRSKN